jgi:hypothetical protein
MKTTVRIIGCGAWFLICDFDWFLRRWQKAKRQRRFFEVRYAGRRMLVNPEQIAYAFTGWE